MGHRLAGRHHHGPARSPSVEDVIGRLSRDLSLDEGQKIQARGIVSEDLAKVKALHERTRGEFETQRSAFHGRLREILKPEQLDKFETMSRRWEESHKKGLASEGPGMPPPPQP
jgi:hypothetical protein